MATSKTRKRRKKEQTEYFFDYSLLFIVLFLLGFGLIMIYSASSYEAFNLFGDGTYYLKKQVVAVLMGLVAMWIVSNIPYHVWERFTGLIYMTAVVLLVLIIPFGVKANGAKRWLRVPVIGMSIQPAEVAKIAVILMIAVVVCKMGKNVKSMKGFIMIMAIPAPLAAMILFVTRNMSSAIIVMGIAVLMVFVASPDYKKFVIMALLAVAAVALVIFIAVSAEGTEGGFRIARIQAWLDPESDAQGKGFQTLQALYAIGSGGIWGKGLGESMQKLEFLPEAQNDMIFSIICEELGLFGGIAIILMFIMLIWRMMIIANNAPDLFGAMLVVGVIGHIAIQAILNIAVVTATIPNTGISLPFISYGGSSVMFLLIEIGMVLNVAKRIQLKDM